MTQLKAVHETIKMWLRLAKHPEMLKRDYLDEIKYTRALNSECFLCQVFVHKDCSGCPLDTTSLMCLPVIDRSAPYWRWEDATNDRERTRQAMRIVNACRRWKAKRKKGVKK